MSSKRIIIVVIILALLTGGYIVFDNTFPVAGPIQCPSVEDVLFITISTDDGLKADAHGVGFAGTIIQIQNAKPTRKMSVNDTPAVRPYYKLEVATEERVFRYYVYEEQGKVYIELPYVGVYVTDGEIINILANITT